MDTNYYDGLQDHIENLIDKAEEISADERREFKKQQIKKKIIQEAQMRMRKAAWELVSDSSDSSPKPPKGPQGPKPPKGPPKVKGPDTKPPRPQNPPGQKYKWVK